jgi:stage II sporulation protein D
LVLTHEGKLIDALYTSTDGGSTEDVEKVFPNRSEPYLRAKSGYVATLKRFELPSKVVDRSQFAEGSEELAAKLVLWGFATVPDLRGQFTGKDLKMALGQFAWVFGNDPVLCDDGPISHHVFWTALANLAFFKAAAVRQVAEADLEIMLRSYSLPAELRTFAGLAVRYELLNADRLATFSSTAPIGRATAYNLLIELCQALGPTPIWQRYRVERVVDGALEVSRGGQTKTLDLSLFSHYITYVGERIEFIDKPQVEEWDRIYLLDEPFTAKILRVRESGSVASVDRFSAYDSWIEKKTLAELEARVRRYVPELRGLRNVRVLDRSETGRVTQLAFDADSGVHQVDGLNVRWSLGVRENLFDLIPGYRDGKLVHLTVLGRGWGHGVGMSQVGAFTLARMGWDYQKILTYYYTGVEVRPLSELSAL